VVNETESLFTRLQRLNISSAMVDTRNNIASFAQDTTSIVVTTDEEAVAAVCDQSGPRFMFTRLRVMESSEPVSARLSQLDGYLSRIMESLPPASACIVFSGHGDVAEASALLKSRSEYTAKCAKLGIVNVHAAGEAFTEQDLARLELAIARGRIGSAMIALKE
jgi:hypothetical protein